MLFESCVLATTLAFINPADPSGKTIYPSGIKDNGNFIFSAPPVSAYPILTIGSQIKLEDDYIIQPGNYCVKPSVDETQIIIIEGFETICVCQVIENTIVESFAAKPIVKIIPHGKDLILTYQIENILKKAIIPTSKEN
ncbi:MAG: hypothetical protein WCF95_03765 [bacterium]